MKKVLNQQGDVILNEGVIPPEAKKINLTGLTKFVIEKGEGVNTHELVSVKNETDVIEQFIDLYELNDTYYVRVKPGKQIKLKHQEHKEQILHEGIHEKINEREFDYEQMEARKTID